MDAVEVAREIPICLQLTEIGEDLAEGPLLIATGRPIVVVLREASEEELAVDGAGATGRLATGEGDGLGWLRGSAGRVPPIMRAKGGE